MSFDDEEVLETQSGDGALELHSVAVAPAFESRSSSHRLGPVADTSGLLLLHHHGHHATMLHHHQRVMDSKENQ